MPSTLQKTLIVLALLLSLITQAAAAVPSSCTMMQGPGVEHSSAVNHDHHTHRAHGGSGHHHGAPELTGAPADAEDGCCQPDGACSMTSCATLSALPSSAMDLLVQPLPTRVVFAEHSFASAALASLYRPPISH